MKHAAFAGKVGHADLVRWYRDGRRTSRALFRIPAAEAYYDRPIPLRNPIVFYDGHMPAFAVNTLVKLALRGGGIDDEYEVLFARGIDPADERSVRSAAMWPAREHIEAYGRAADELVEDALASAVLERSDVPQLVGGEAAFTILEHEAMHHETLLYMLHELPYEKKQALAPLNTRSRERAKGETSPNDLVRVPAGRATLGADRGTFGWDNEFEKVEVDVDDFAMQRFDVTNGEFMEFVEAGGYRDSSHWTREGFEWLARNAVAHPRFWTRVHGVWLWRGTFELLPLDARAPVYVTHAEAEAYARWRGMRLPTEAEYHRAAFGDPSGIERSYPWGEEAPDVSRGNFDFLEWDPLPVGSFPSGASAWGIHDLVGNGWEWTSTPFGPFRGFTPMSSYPVYSADFFDGQHYVMKGASPVTARQLIRRSLRNWFRPTYPYVYATFRCVRPSS